MQKITLFWAMALLNKIYVEKKEHSIPNFIWHGKLIEMHKKGKKQKPGKKERHEEMNKKAARRQRQRQVRTKAPVFSIQTDTLVHRKRMIAQRPRKPLNVRLALTSSSAGCSGGTRAVAVTD